MQGAHLSPLIEKFRNHTAAIGVVGLGYVGLPLLLRFTEAGLRTLGFDIDPDKASTLQRGESYIKTIAAERVAAARGKAMDATTDYARAGAMDALIVCVPTPLTPAREPDLSYVIATIEALAPHLRAGQVLALESTTYPGTTEEEVAPRISARGFSLGEDFFLVYSPEREDPGNTKFDTRTIPKLVSGATAACLEAGIALYAQAVDRVVPMSSTRAAEMTKLLENIHRAVNIGLVNEMKIVADRMGIDIHEVVRAAATKPFGFAPYTPGPGLGGHCIPIDPFYLAWKARRYGVEARFVELAGEVNRAMPGWVVGKVAHALAARDVEIKGSRILVLGLAYKKNVDDVRETPAAEIMALLIARGAQVDYSDPHVPRFPRMRAHAFELESVPLDETTLVAYDCIVLVTDHDAFDYAFIRHHARLLVDTRGRFREIGGNIVSA